MLAEINALEARIIEGGVEAHALEAPKTASDVYALLLLGRPVSVQERATGSYAAEDVEIIVHATAPTPMESLWLAERIDKILRPNGWGITLAIPGRSLDPLRRTDALGPEFDETGDAYWDTIQAYSTLSRPA